MHICPFNPLKHKAEKTSVNLYITLDSSDHRCPTLNSAQPLSCHRELHLRSMGLRLDPAGLLPLLFDLSVLFPPKEIPSMPMVGEDRLWEGKT